MATRNLFITVWLFIWSLPTATTAAASDRLKLEFQIAGKIECQLLLSRPDENASHIKGLLDGMFGKKRATFDVQLEGFPGLEDTRQLFGLAGFAKDAPLGRARPHSSAALTVFEILEDVFTDFVRRNYAASPAQQEIFARVIEFFDGRRAGQVFEIEYVLGGGLHEQTLFLVLVEGDGQDSGGVGVGVGEKSARSGILFANQVNKLGHSYLNERPEGNVPGGGSAAEFFIRPVLVEGWVPGLDLFYLPPSSAEQRATDRTPPPIGRRATVLE